MILDRYIAFTLLRGIMITLCVLVLLISLAALVKELDDVGQGQYGLGEALNTVFFTIPERALDLLPVSALVGGIIGLGSLAAGQELLAMRAVGVSPVRVAGAAIKTALPLIIVMAVLSEEVVPPLSQEASRRKRLATLGPDATLSEEAIWLKEGDTIVRIGRVRGGDALEDVEVFRFDETSRLREVLTARSGSLRPGKRWVLFDVRREVLSKLTPQSDDVQEMASPIRLEALDLLASPVELLSVSKLWREQFSKDGPNPVEEIRRTLWRRLSTPLLLLVMMVLSVPLALTAGGRTSIGSRLAAGAVLGVLAHVGVQVLIYLGWVARLDPALAALLPVLLIGSLAWYLVARL